MILPAQRRCDVCHGAIEPGTKFVTLRYQLYEDNEPQPGISSGGTIHASNEVEAHEQCCGPDFFPLLDLRRRSHSADRSQKNRWSHENVTMDPAIAAAVMGQKS